MLNERIGPTTARFAVLGASLPHTWSPYIHNSLFDAAKIDAIYVPIAVSSERLASAVDVFRSCFAGFNITIPYKEKIIPYLDEIDGAVSACGAVNTVEIRDGRMIGHITDGLGMLRAIEEQGITTKQADVLILGNGGAARVAGYEFLAKGGRVTFAVRNKQKERNWSANWLIRKKTGIIVFPFVRSTIVQVRMIF
ncbi:MAG: shikimate dehydrogenase family protein [Christensenellales bacterium]